MYSDIFRRLVEHSPEGYAYHEIITDCEGNPIDSVCLYANPAFERMTGFPKEDVIGKRFTEVHHRFAELKSSWIDICGKVALTGKTARFEEYFEDTSRWYAISAYSDESGYFAVVFLDITQSKNREEAVLQSEESFRITLDSIGDAVICADHSGRVIRINPEAERLTGWVFDEAKGRPMTEVFRIVNAHTREPVADPVKEALVSGKTVGIANHTTLIAKDGAEYQIADSAAPIRDAGGNSTGAVLVFRDVTEEYRMQEALRQSEERFQTLMTLVPDMVSIQDPDMNIAYSNWNGFGAVAEESRLVNTKCYETYRGYEDICPDCPAVSVLDSKKPLQIEVELPNDRWADLRVIPMLDEDGNIEFFVKWARDITERKQMETELSEAKERLQLISDNMLDLVAVTDLQGNYRFAGASHRVLGYDVRTLIGKNVMDFVHPGDLPQVKEAFEEFLTNERNRAQVTYRYRCADGSYLWLETLGSFLLDETGEVSEILFNTRDITDRKQAEDAARENAHRFYSLFNAMSSGAAIYKVLNDGANGKDYIVMDFNQSALQIENKVITQVQGKSLYDLRPNIDEYGLISLFQQVWKTGEANHFPVKAYIDDEYYNWYENRVFRLPTGEIVAIYDDVTEKMLTANKLEESEEKHRLLIMQMTQGLAVHERVFDKAGDVIDYRLVDVNPAFEQFAELKREAIIGKSALEVLPKAEHSWMEKYDHVAMTGEPLFIEDYSKELEKYFEASIYSSKPGQIATVFNDITERKQAEQKIEYLSYHDGLTELYNRRFFDQELQRLDVPRNMPLTLLMLDVNGLKLTNDAFGHPAGDQLLVRVAAVLQDVCRADDIIARVGGDEFAILLPETGEAQAKGLAKRIRRSITLEEVEGLPISISCGWDTKTDPQESIADVFQTAENLMYQHKTSERSSYRHQSIHLIMQTLYAKSPREQQHSKRVSQLCRNLATAMGLEVSELTTAGLLHDIGKVATSNEILDKSGSLTDSEWREVKRHPEVGYSILSALNDYAMLAEYVLAHHERWDGSGYPRGLKGEEIPLAARIMNVADAYDAMVRDRPYRKAMSHGDAMEEIQACAGRQFDPEVASLFIEMIGEDEVGVNNDA